TVQLASQCPFTGGGCYDMTDRGTFNRLVADGAVTNLKIVSDDNDANARGGQNLLTNPFTGYAGKPDKVPNVKSSGGKAFITYLTSNGFQKKVPKYPSTKDPAFFPDARAKIKLEDKLPKHARKGKKIRVRGNVTNLLPGSPLLKADPIELQGKAIKN